MFFIAFAEANVTVRLRTVGFNSERASCIKRERVLSKPFLIKGSETA